VQPGQQVLKYQRLADADSEYGVALHAPTSGRIIAIRPQAQALPGAPLANTLILEADGRDEALPLQAGDPSLLTPLSLALQLQDMGVAGNHGPLLPLDRAMQQHARPLLIINAVEDEPCLDATTTLLEQQADDIVAAIALLEQVLQPGRIVIAISQPDSGQVMQAQPANEAGTSASSTRPIRQGMKRH
jgi:electron transport complex protein RnfC